MRTYSNGAYTVYGEKCGFWKWARLKGVVVGSKYPLIYKIGAIVNLPIYHNFGDKKPQFKEIK